MKILLILLMCVWWVYLINGEVIKAKSITRGRFEPDYKVITTDDRVIRVPFTSVLKMEERAE